MSRRRRLILPVTMSVLVLAALIFAIVATRETSGGGSSTGTTVTGPAAQAPLTRGGFDGVELPGAKAAPQIELLDQYGRPASLRALRGEPVLIAFLNTSCGGPCTLIAQQIRGALDLLDRPVPVLIVSTDPRADTPQAVRRFLAEVALSGRVYYLTGAPDTLAAVWRAFGAKPAGRGTFDRGAQVLLLDAAGRERVLFDAEDLTPDALAHDAGRLQDG